MLQSPSQIVIEEWQRRVHAEYNSAILSARLLLFLKAHTNISARFTALCKRIVQDELSHAKMGVENLLAWGVTPPYKVKEITIPKTLEPLDNALIVILTSFALGETFAVPIFQGMLANAQNPHAKKTLKQIVKDERMHSSFGWELLDAVLLQFGVSAHQECQDCIVETVAQFHHGYAGNHVNFVLAQSDLEYGLLDGLEYQQIWLKSYREVVYQKLRQRGFSIPLI